MNWLVTLAKGVDLTKIKRTIESVGGELDSDFPQDITIGDDVVISVKGPDNLSDVLKKATTDVLGVYPNSDVTLF